MFEPPPPSAARLWSFVPTAPGHSLYCVPKNRPHCAPGRAGPPLAITGHVFTTINLLTREKGSHRTRGPGRVGLAVHGPGAAQPQPPPVPRGAKAGHTLCAMGTSAAAWSQPGQQTARGGSRALRSLVYLSPLLSLLLSLLLPVQPLQQAQGWPPRMLVCLGTFLAARRDAAKSQKPAMPRVRNPRFSNDSSFLGGGVPKCLSI